jgi:GntR family transcriptional regulator / MocR family aminotransferase
MSIIARSALDLGAPEAYQAALTDFIVEGHFARHLRRMRCSTELVEMLSWKACIRSSAQCLKWLAEKPECIWRCFCRKVFCDEGIAEQAALQKLWLWPLSPSYLGESPRQGFILGFGGTQAQEMAPAVQKLGAVLKARRIFPGAV